MRRRDLLKLTAAAPALALLTSNRTTDHPSVDQPWPLDLRTGFENNTLGVNGNHTEVWLDGVKQGGVVAVDPETGHILKYIIEEAPSISPEEEQRLLKLLADTEFQEASDWLVYNYRIEMTDTGAHLIKIIRPRTNVVTRSQPCCCKPGMHSYTAGNDRCCPLQIRRGHVELRRMA